MVMRMIRGDLPMAVCEVGSLCEVRVGPHIDIHGSVQCVLYLLSGQEEKSNEKKSDDKKSDDKKTDDKKSSEKAA
ncbi:hypothetical protein V490_09177 [Pseudogymnoascus sp. VKM F-3557]|nr:hypothetical protein V490_09177 [Pseudogymnoascus sp. VKM F-3557]